MNILDDLPQTLMSYWWKQALTVLNFVPTHDSEMIEEEKDLSAP